MSIHLHLRAVAEAEIRDDHSWLAAFMLEAWSNNSDEYAAGIADSIDKVWNSVNDLYAAADLLAADVDKAWTLPFYGGRPVPHSADVAPTNPPLMILEPPEVSRAADFLTTVSFDDLWHVAGAEISGIYQDESLARLEFLDHHRGLRGFYERAASTGHAVVKAVWA